jgi:hypothetical protein
MRKPNLSAKKPFKSLSDAAMFCSVSNGGKSH